jgi:signal transduction histidine kinase
MSKLINDLLDFTRTHLGPGIPIRVKEASLVEICEEVVNELRTFHPEKMIELQVPPQLEAIFDESRIAQVLSNLIGNAVQYGSVDTPVEIRVTSNGDDIAVAVTNHGTPIAAEKIASVFDPMVRIAASVNADYTERTSLGIGLYISRQIVIAHGGKIDVTSNAVDGTTFTVTMPRLPAAFRSPDPEARSSSLLAS